MEKIATRGRPREFDKDEVLGAALQVFWQKGYEGASLSDLTDAMGITRPSLYAAFGNKEALFLQALDRYEKDKLAYIGEAVDALTARAVAENLLLGAVEVATGGESRGCMGVISSVACQSIEPSIRGRCEQPHRIGAEPDHRADAACDRCGRIRHRCRRRRNDALPAGNHAGNVGPGPIGRYSRGTPASG